MSCCVDPLSLALAEISFSVADLTKKNYKLSTSEIQSLIEKHGAEAERHLFRCLFSVVDFSSDGKNSGKDFHQCQFLIQECQELLTKPNFASILCYSIDNPEHTQKTLKPSPHLLPQISKVLKLSRVQEVVFGIGLLSSSNEEIKSFAGQFVKQKLPDLLRTYIDADLSGNQEGGLNDVAIEVLHLLLSHLLYAPRDLVGIGDDQVQAFLDTLRRDFPKERVPVVLAPLLYPNQQEIELDRLLPDNVTPPKLMMEEDLSELMQEIGYSCCSTIEDCQDTLAQFGVNDITAPCIARVLGMMAKTVSGLTDHLPVQNLSSTGSIGDKSMLEDALQQSVGHWNVDIFVEVVKAMVPSLNWIEVILALDHPGFIIKGEDSLRLVMSACHRGLQEMFPIQVLYRAWSNTEGQLSWIQQSMASSDVFCFVDYPCHTVVVDILKNPPEDENREVATWKSLDLVETLLRLAESGHYENVLKLFQFPLKHCPDVLLLALLQTNPTWQAMRNELVSQLIPVFLANHPNSASVLHYVWHGQGQSSSIRQLVMQAMADWYMKGDQLDQSRLSRILDVAQDLKALSMLLNGSPYAFVIDLAALASRREYLKLDKWLNDKLREHQVVGEPKEGFAQACVQFLKRRCPQLTGVMSEKELPKSAQLPAETVSTMLSCLQQYISQASNELAESIRQLLVNHGPLMKARQPPPGVAMPPVKRTEGGMPAPIGTQVDPMTGLTIPSSVLPPTPSTPSSQLPLFPPHPLGGNSSSLGSIGSLPSGLHSPGFSSQNPLLQQLQQPGLSQGGGLGSSMLSSSSSMSDAFRSPSDSLGTQKPQSLSSMSLTQTLQQQQQQQQQQFQTHIKQQSSERIRQTTGDVSAVWPGMDQQFTKDVEDEANSYFQKIYNHPPNLTISIDEVLEMLKKFKDSAVKKERDIFLCMLRNLFEEYRFFPQYPDKELHITACLFGGIIEQGLVTYMALGIALRYVLDALRKPLGNKMYCFGIAALDRFKTRLKDYPHYCQHLASIPHFRDFPPHLIEYIEFGQTSKEPPVPSRAPQDTSSLFGRSTSAIGRPSSSTPPLTMVTRPSPLGTSTLTTMSTTTKTTPSPVLPPAANLRGKEPSIANANNIDTLLVATDANEVAQPPENVQDKIHFIFNNISQSNMQTKADELKELVSPEHFPWVSQYLVMKRASIEPNFHQVYIGFIDALSMPDFTKEVLHETYRNIKVLLQSDKVPANFSDRSLLKNLGHWLGLQTLARNRPILMRDLDVKSLIIEAFFKGQHNNFGELLYVVPFVTKVMESSAKSKVFKPPNPWVMAIMGVLVELHQIPDLKLNLKFEVEVLCNSLSLDMKDIEPTELLKDPEKLHHIPHQLSSPEKEKQAISSAGTTDTTSTSTAAGQGGQTPTPPPPQFSYHEINSQNHAGLAPHIKTNAQIPLFQHHPHLKQCVRVAVERAVQELVHPVVERSIKICLTTAEMIVKKDFALDPDETRMRAAAHHMVRFMTAGMALITCREPLLISINNNLRSNFLQALRGASQQQKEMVDQAAQLVSEENTELACAFIQKTAVEKALPEMDKRLATEFELRRHARSGGRRYCDPVVLTYQAERMPEQIRLKVGGVTPNQTAVYEEFARSIPGFQAPAPGEILSTPPPPKPLYDHSSVPNSESFMPDEVVQILGKCAAEIEQHLHAIIVPTSNTHVMAIHALLEAVVQARISRDNMAAIRLLHKAVEGMLDGIIPVPSDTELSLRYRDCHLIVLRGLQDPRGYGPLWTARHVTKFICECPQEIKFNVEAIDLLIRSHLINMREFDLHIVQCMDNGHNLAAVRFAIQLARIYLVDEKHNLEISAVKNDLYHTIEALTRIANTSRSTEGLSSLLEVVHNGPVSVLNQHSAPGAPTPDQLDKAPGGPVTPGVSFQGYVAEDPPGLREKVEYLLREWARLYHAPGAGKDSEKAFSTFVALLQQHGILKTDDIISRFFKICTELCVEIAYRALMEHSGNPAMARAKCFHYLDAYCRLIALLVRHSGDATNNVTKINLLNRVLGTIATVLLHDHQCRHLDFQQLPYHRLLIMLLIELNQPEPVLEAINFQVLHSFSTVLHHLKPSRVPGFAYAWLELISHRLLMSKLLLNTPQQKGWVLFQQLLTDLFKFLAPFLRNAELAKQTHLLYKGTLRVLLVLLHDFPEFLCDYHFSFCDVIPPNCIQMRNLILSAFPRNMRLPDPFTPNLKVDLLTDITHSPRILTNFASAIQPPTFKKDLDSYLKTRAPVTFLTELRSHLQVVTSELGTRYNVPLMNALVLYVGTQAIAYIHSKSGTPSMSTITHSSHMDIFQNLAVGLDTEGRYLFLNAIANQLRYPNSHTHYFSCVLLYLFAEANTEAIQEQITRVLLERLIVNRPHPWGLLITFIELIKNHQYKFWTHEFVHCAPEIEKLFESVARSCMQQKQPPREAGEARD